MEPRTGEDNLPASYLSSLTSKYGKSVSRSTAEPEGVGDSHKLVGQELDYYSPNQNKRLGDDYELFSKNQILYLTPPELATDMASYSLSKLNLETDSVDFGDPAVGTGVFFSTLLKLAKDKLRSAIGIDIDANRVNETRKRWSHQGLKVERGDYLHMDKLPQRSLILANPPYVRYQEVPKAYRQKLQERASVQLGMRISGQSSLYVYFLILSHGWMKREAVAAWLIPSEFMETNYGEVVRKYLTQKVQLIRIHRFSPSKIQFENALVSSAVVVYRNCPPSPDQPVLLSSGGNLSHPDHTEQVTLSELINEAKWKVPWTNHGTKSSIYPRIGDILKVNRGLATGANAFFIMERNIAMQLGIPAIALRPVLPKARALNTNIIEREPDGYPKIFPQLCLLDCGLSLEEIRLKYPLFLEYLENAPEEVKKSTLVRGRKPWYHQEQRQPPPFLCTYMGRGSNNCDPLYFLRNKSDAVATNTYLMLYPREILAKVILKQPDVLEKVFELLMETSSDELVSSGRVYGGGLHKIEPKELLNVRLPRVPNWLEGMIQESLPMV